MVKLFAVSSADFAGRFAEQQFLSQSDVVHHVEISFSGFHTLHFDCVDIAERMFLDQDVIGVLTAYSVGPFGSVALIIVQFGLNYFFEDFSLPFDDPVEVVVLGVVMAVGVVDEAVGRVGAVAVLAIFVAVAIVALLSSLG